MIALTHVNTRRPDQIQFLYSLLRERRENQSISHQRMPSHDAHEAFVATHPYRVWYLIHSPKVGPTPVGACYLTHDNRIGISILQEHRRKGYAIEALRVLVATHPPLPAQPSQRAGRYLADINPSNEGSIQLFEKLGMKHIANTYAL